MQRDIVQRLKDEHARNGGQGAYAWQSRELCGKAATEITRLTEALRAAEERVEALRDALGRIAHRDPWTDPDSPERIAREALKEQPHD